MGFGALAGAIGSAIGGNVIDGLFNQRAQDRARAASEDIYRSRYQIMVQDMKAAGLNPMLAYSKDPGAAPSVGGGQIVGGTGQAINSARATSAQSALMREQEEKVRAEKDNVEADTKNKLAMANQIEAQTYQLRASGQLADSQTGQIRALLPSLIKKNMSEAEAAELALPKLRNLSAAEFTQWKKDIAPFLEDAVLATQAGANLGRVFNPMTFLSELTKKRAATAQPNHYKRGTNYGR